MVLEPVYEQDFLDCSYGFRPGRNAHQALDALWKGLMDIGGGWVIDLDIQDFFGSMERTHLNAFLDQRVRDGVIRRVLGKWMQAGVMDEGVIRYPERGSPQGAVISLASNIYLHEVLDTWFEREVKPRLLRGRAFLVRFADDATDGLRAGRRRSTGVEGPAQAPGALGVDPAPREDLTGGLSQSGRGQCDRAVRGQP
ncbi:reverse transcriptase domain-containing protein [Lamprobacter modestohalophilus]|uniref:reverse transcriptase domain-containing protein n=1 Tax=Lamprobacter modestohalophilus TaxID=1064514 RepID=UPI002ADEBAAC|nr:reverse transcriptase domain-containing protein [Lamprobacter modestohalophilus]MEA1052688.1 reverse transcriptase domain-containing protein [Lamprobacter modestohalophilus]